MRYYDIKLKLDEVRMAPSDLKKFANSPEAKGIMAGFEAEVIFRGANEREDYEESEPDYDADRRTNSIDNIINFFEGNGEYNSDRDIESLREELVNDYWEWLAEQSSEYFFANANRIVKEWIEGEDWDWDEQIENALKAADYSSDEIEAALEAAKAIAKARSKFDSEELEAAKKQHLKAYELYVKGKELADDELDKVTEETIESQNKNYYMAQENAREAFEEDTSDEDWLSQTDLRYMSDISNNYAIEWPIWTYGGDDDNEGTFSEEAAKRVAVNFRNAMPNVQKVVVTNWAGKDKDQDTWYFESDSSIEPDDSNDLAVEIVSPPMPLKECLEMMDKFFTWLQKNDGYTNESTGFHMGVSMPEQDTTNVDFTKLALFLGDKYVLDEFGRMGNTYCKSALGKIENRVKSGEIDPKRALEALRQGLNEIASKIIASNEGFGKFTTINPKQNYIEFRTAGGEDYSEDIPKLQNTLSRYAQSMYIASNPNMYRSEYQKKMYKLLSASEDSTDTIKELSKLSAGKTSDQDIQTWYSHMKEVLKKSETKRIATKGGTLLVWRVYKKDNSNASSDVIAMTAKEAIKIDMKYDRSTWSVPENEYRAEPIRKATAEEIERYNAAKAKVSTDQAGADRARYRIRNLTTGEALVSGGTFLNSDEAIKWAKENRPDLFGSSDNIEAIRGQGQQPVETEPQNFPAAGNTFTGQWKVVSAATGEVLYTFGGVGNSQSEANRIAQGWAARTRFDDAIEVYPIMR
jgi:hypothetical protein